MTNSEHQSWLSRLAGSHATLVTSTDGTIAIINDEKWDLNSILKQHDELFVLDFHGRQGGCKIANPHRSGEQSGSHKDPCDWQTLLDNGNRSVSRAARECTSYSVVSLLLFRAINGATDLRASNGRLDECDHYLHEGHDHPNRRRNRMQRARHCAFILATGYTSRDPAVKHFPHPIEAITPDGRPERYSLRLTVPGLYRTPRFSLALLHEFITYDLLSRRHDPAERKAVKGITRLIRSLPATKQEKAWDVVHKFLR